MNGVTPPLVPKNTMTQTAALAGGGGLVGVIIFLINSLVSMQTEIQHITDTRETALQELRELDDDVDELNARVDDLYQVLAETGVVERVTRP
jgi:hypothetical protein